MEAAKIRELKGDGSKFIASLQGWDVIEKNTMKIIPKYILWSICGCQLGPLAETILNKTHEKYVFAEKELVMKNDKLQWCYKPLAAIN